MASDAISNDLIIGYGRLRRLGVALAILGFPCAIGFGVWFLLISLSAKYSESGTETIVLVCLAVVLFVAPCLLIPAYALLEGTRRRVVLRPEQIEYQTSFGTTRLDVSLVREIEWRLEGAGRIDIFAATGSVAIPLHGLSIADAKHLVKWVRETFSPEQQRGWRPFLYDICYGRLSGRRFAVSGRVFRIETAVIAFLASIMLAAVFAARYDNELFYIVIACCFLSVVVVGLPLRNWIRSMRESTRERLADELVLHNGEEVPFDVDDQATV